MAKVDRISLWPGPRDLLPVYCSGWDAYSAFYLRCCDQGRGVSAFADPDDHAPVALTGAIRSVWCMGWLEAMIANDAINRKREGGIADDVSLWRVANAEVDMIRATYLPNMKRSYVQ